MTEKKPPATDEKHDSPGFGGILLLIAGVLLLAALIALAVYVAIKYDYSMLKQGPWKLLGLFFKQIGLMLVFSAAVIMIVWIILIFQTATGRWRSIRIFLSYQHEHSDLVKALGNTLKSRWISPDFIPYIPADHDKTIGSVQQLLKSADLIIVLPGLEKSFVDAEILAASALAKPIIFLKVNSGQKTPDTSYKGYPVFDLSKLEEFQFRPLQRFILYVSRSSRDITRNFARATKGLRKKASVIFIVFFIVSVASSIIGPLVNVFISPEWEQKTHIYKYWGIIFLAVIIFVIKYIQVVLDKLLAIRVTRQKIITGELTHELLSKGLGGLAADQQIIDCILLHSLPVRH